MSDDLEEAGRMLDRRTALKTGGSAIATALAGCAGKEGTETGTQESADSSTGTDEPTDTDTGTDTDTETPQPPSFIDLYNSTFEADERPLREEQVARLQDLTAPELFLRTKRELGENLNYGKRYEKAANDMRRAFVNQLDIGPEQARSGVMRTGGNGFFMTHKFKTTVDGEEVVRKMTGLAPTDQEDIDPLYIPWEEDHASRGGWDAFLENVWRQEDLTVGSALAIDKYREGVEAGGTFEEYVIEEENPAKWLAASKALDGQNDFLAYNAEKKERIEWGEIGYSRTAADKIRDIADIHNNVDFTQEWEMEETVTEFYHNTVVEDDETFMHIDFTESGLEEDQRELTEVDGGTLYAETCGLEQHKKDVYEIAIPDSHWEEGERYPGDVELPDKWKE